MARLVTGSLRRYLQASRGRYCLLLPGTELPELYAETFTGLVAELAILLQGEFTPPELVVVYSGTAHAETVGLDAGRSVVVYDQYLGQVLNRLNRLYFEQAPELEVSAYLNKVSAARSLVAGQPKSALRHATLFAALAEHLTASGYEGHDQRRTYTTVAEAFVLAHELTHFAYHSNPPATLLLEDFYLDLISAVIPGNRRSQRPTGKDRTARTRAASTRLVDRQRRLREHGEAAPGLSRADAIKQLSASLPRYLRTFGPMTPALLEECVCDGVAVLITTGWALQQGIRVGDGVLGSFLALHNLRLLRWIDAWTAHRREDAPASAASKNRASGGVVGQTQLRFDLFRYIVDAWLSCMWNGLTPDGILPADGPGRRGGAAGLIDAMIDLNEQYADIIFDHATSSFEVKYAKVIATTDLDSVLRRDPGEDAYDVVRRVCDFPGWRAPTRRAPGTAPTG
jgi:hypothetical protein